MEPTAPIAESHYYHPDFKGYARKNPYDERLKAFEGIVFRDEEAEAHQGKWGQLFGNDKPVVVEVGTGYGDFMLAYSAENPDKNFVGLDHRYKRSFHLAKKLEASLNKNFRYLRGRGERLSFIFAENEISELFYFFPDPWPKTRHHKKRLFQKPFLDDAYKTLRPGGKIWIKTDHDDYFRWMLERLQTETERFQIVFQSSNLREEHPEHFLAQHTTRFEKIFLSQGKKIKALELLSLKR